MGYYMNRNSLSTNQKCYREVREHQITKFKREREPKRPLHQKFIWIQSNRNSNKNTNTHVFNMILSQNYSNSINFIENTIGNFFLHFNEMSKLPRHHRCESSELISESEYKSVGCRELVKQFQARDDKAFTNVKFVFFFLLQTVDSV